MKAMHKVLKAIVILAWGAAPGLFAQTAELPFFWAYLRSPAQPESWVVADLRVDVLRDAGGAIDSGGSDVRLRYNLRDQMTLTAVRIHRPRGEDPGAVSQPYAARGGFPPGAPVGTAVLKFERGEMKLALFRRRDGFIWFHGGKPVGRSLATTAAAERGPWGAEGLPGIRWGWRRPRGYPGTAGARWLRDRTGRGVHPAAHGGGNIRTNP
jgi:hypothetical protein